jgi:hypothetical protein
MQLNLSKISLKKHQKDPSPMVRRLGDLENVAESSNLAERYSQLCFSSKNLFMGIEIAINRFFYFFVKFWKNNGDLLNNGDFQNINESVEKNGDSP